MQLVRTAQKNKLQALVLAALTAGAVFTAVAGAGHAEAQPRPAAVADGGVQVGVVLSGDGVTVQLGSGDVDPWS
ncbi:hypothetical protein ACIRU3_30670 [Streptomyces sp. NPDC101151]|uniref:hypothetical protein n=1 Tax=Streptomyces sp. NPDC101151 TaxID=3366115 RepID=UPI00381E5F99